MTCFRWSHSFLLTIVVLFGTIVGCSTSYAGRTVGLIVSSTASPQIEFGATAIRREIASKPGFSVRMADHSSPTDIRILLGKRGDRLFGSESLSGITIPEDPESYVIERVSPRTIMIEGSDSTGAMYGAEDLAEQIAWSKGDDWLSGISPKTQSPYLAIRGINMFLTTQDIDLADGAFWSDDFWRHFFDMMARNRYNLLDIHGPCEASSVEFADGFSYFLSLPDFPEVGVGPERARRNLARFRQVIHWARERGVKVGYMNYVAAPTIGPWKTGIYGKTLRWQRPPQKFLTGPRLEVYVREAVTSFLKQLPELWMFGFRIGESGQEEDFYKKTYVAAIQAAPHNLNVYARTWHVEPERIRELSRIVDHPFFIEPKYNGEHLGLPYQAVQGSRPYPPSGSYEDYTDYPRNYSILWQIRAHGTHRIFYWGWPEFARRTVRSCRFGGGVGFSMEMMSAYCPEADYIHNNPQTDHHFYRWMFQRNWPWYLIWGRTAYNPEVSDQVWLNEFAQRFGEQAGQHAYRALIESSKIVPMIYAYHNQGLLDHIEFAPEFETGDHAMGVRSEFWQGQRLVTYGGDNFSFLEGGTLDPTAMVDPAAFVEGYLKGQPTGKMTPFQASDYLKAAAEASVSEMDQAARSNPDAEKNFDCMQMDVQAVAWLGRYYSDRILSATHLAFYQKTYDHPELSLAYKYLERATDDWDHLSEVTDKHFGYVPELIRMRANRFRWREEGRSLGVDLEQLNRMEQQFQDLQRPEWWKPVRIGHVPQLKVTPGKSVKLMATYVNPTQTNHLFLLYRNSQETAYKKIEMTEDNPQGRTWKAEIPAPEALPGCLEYYFEARSGPLWKYGSTLASGRPYRIIVSSDNSRPVISFEKPAHRFRGDSIDLTIRVHAQAKITSARVYFKPMPSTYDWQVMEMHAAGDSHYQAKVPVTPEGILYYFSVVDSAANAARYPNFLEQTPYFVIDAWAVPSAGAIRH